MNKELLQDFVDAVLYQKPKGWCRKEVAREIEKILQGVEMPSVKDNNVINGGDNVILS